MARCRVTYAATTSPLPSRSPRSIAGRRGTRLHAQSRARPSHPFSVATPEFNGGARRCSGIPFCNADSGAIQAMGHSEAVRVRTLSGGAGPATLRWSGWSIGPFRRAEESTPATARAYGQHRENGNRVRSCGARALPDAAESSPRTRRPGSGRLSGLGRTTRRRGECGPDAYADCLLCSLCGESTNRTSVQD